MRFGRLSPSLRRIPGPSFRRFGHEFPLSKPLSSRSVYALSSCDKKELRSASELQNKTFLTKLGSSLKMKFVVLLSLVFAASPSEGGLRCGILNSLPFLGATNDRACRASCFAQGQSTGILIPANNLEILDFFKSIKKAIATTRPSATARRSPSTCQRRSGSCWERCPSGSTSGKRC